MEPIEEYWIRSHDFPKYDVSSWGRIAHHHTGHILQPTTNGRSLIVCLQTSSGNSLTVPVKRVVAELFLEKPKNPGYIPTYKDTDYTNCAADNLMWLQESDIYWRAEMHRQGNFDMEARGVVVEEIDTAMTLWDAAVWSGQKARDIFYAALRPRSDVQLGMYTFRLL